VLPARRSGDGALRRRRARDAGVGRVAHARARSREHRHHRAACGDFYQYANGAWRKRTELPAAYTQYSTFRDVADRADSVVHVVLEDAANGSSDHSTREAGFYYATCMDTTTIDVQGERHSCSSSSTVMSYWIRCT